MSKIIHPNFRFGQGQKNIQKRTRALMLYISQEVYDRLMIEVDHGRAKHSGEVVMRAIETYLRLPEGEASPKASGPA